MQHLYIGHPERWKLKMTNNRVVVLNDPKLNQLALVNTGTINIQNEIEVLKSKPLMERVVNSLESAGRL